MVVQHNLMAMNSNRMLGITTSTQSKTTEKLSSGYKINRAADDAAGLAISEKMRKQMRGLTQASLNAQDGISSVQTAEGALNEVHDMLQRINELAVKAANGTNSESDRQAIQDEVDQLVTEIDRVSTTTKFNETYLLKGVSKNGVNGELTYDTAKIAVDKYGNHLFDIHLNNASDFNEKTGTRDFGLDGETIGMINDPANANTLLNGDDYVIGSVHFVIVKSTQKQDPNDPNGPLSVADAIKYANKDTSNYKNLVYVSNIEEVVKEVRNRWPKDIRNVSSVTDQNGDTFIRVEAFPDKNNAANLNLHVGADSTDENKITLNIANLSARGLGVNGLRVNGDNPDNATAAIDVVAHALSMVSDQRGSLGAIQNRLEHTIANLDNVVENTTAAESAIRDTDMAKEMVKFSNNNILAQAGQAMLAQANQSNQGVLSLLQ
ncbi:MAG: hypothetical protein K6E68_08595 [Lachnospiraceae bacterium]|nr:hypothetical protein [Lachnospiraceae bacterium]